MSKSVNSQFEEVLGVFYRDNIASKDMREITTHGRVRADRIRRKR